MDHETTKAYPYIGQPVYFNGDFEGTIVAIPAWAHNRMIEVRSPSGLVCIDIGDARPRNT